MSASDPAPEDNAFLDRQAAKLGAMNGGERATCCLGSRHYKVGDRLRINSIEWGHVFCYWDGPTSPDMQYPCCVGCGKPWHDVRDEQEGAK